MGRVAALLLSFWLVSAFAITSYALDEDRGTPASAGTEALADQAGEEMDMHEADQDMEADESGGEDGVCGPGCACPMCRKGGMAGKGCCGMACGCKGCRHAGHDRMMRGGMRGGMSSMGGDIDMMTWPPMNKSCRTPDFYLGMKDGLELTDKQVETLERLALTMRKETIMKGAAVKVLEMELSDIVTKTDFKLQDAEAKLKEIEAARLELRKAVVKASAAARDALTPEQLGTVRDIAAGGGPGTTKDPEKMKRMMMEKMQKRMMR